MSQTVVNGDRASSQFIDHLTSYPVVSDGIETFKANSYGRKSLELADSAYSRFGKPVEPYLETPKQYAAPYAKRADELADSGLSQIETHFPIVKEDTNTIVDKGKALIWWPFKVVGDGKDYVWSTYNDEYKKTANHKRRGDGFSTLVLAIISTELRIASDFFQAVADFLGPKYEEGKQTAAEYAEYAKETAEQYAQAGQEKLQHAQKVGQEKLGEAQKVGEEKLNEAQKVGHEKKEEAKHEAHKAKDEAHKKAQK